MANKAIGIILTYNCAPFLPGLLTRIPKGVLNEIIVVDDASVDHTANVAEGLGLAVFAHEHLGYGGNLKYGFTRALERGADYMVEIHGDGQFDPSVIPAALEKLSRGCDFVIGSRFTNMLQPLRDGMSKARYFANIGLSFFDRIILGLPLTEFHTGFRAYSKKLVGAIGTDKGANDYLYSFEIIVMARYRNLRFCEIPVRANYKGAHTSISIRKSAVYSFQTFWVLFLYLLARLGLKTRLFR
ncbi:MAG: glycosyltransferase family 2 protein [Candidatus Sungbacteria bacterium]|nr:glycosyltransferase family 2 protein [Candidatus Sungbacteria bacterium]